MTPKRDEFEHDVKLDVEARVREGVIAVLEEILQEEMSQHLDAGYRELTSTRRGEHQRSLPAQPPHSRGQDRASGANMLEHPFEEVKRRTRVMGIFPNEGSASTLATEIALRSSGR